jgi:hypothetical protein
MRRRSKLEEALPRILRGAFGEHQAARRLDDHAFPPRERFFKRTPHRCLHVAAAARQPSATADDLVVSEALSAEIRWRYWIAGCNFPTKSVV